MGFYLEKYKEKKIKFLSIRYKILESASSTESTATSNFKIRVQFESQKWCGYAEYLLLAFNDKKSLHKGIETIDEVFTRYRLNINTSKIKSIILNSNTKNQNTQHP